jgi:hypothetical protein
VKLNGLSILLSDVLLAGLTLRLAWSLLLEARRLKDRAVALWCAAFCTVAGSVVLTGIWRTFPGTLDEHWSPLLRTSAMVLATAAGLLFLLGVLHGYSAGRVRAIVAGVAVAKFALFSLWIAVNDNFGLVIYDSALTMLVMMVFCTWGAWFERTPSAPWVLAGLLVSMLGALFQQGRVSVHPRFDHNDLYHVIQMAAMYFLYRGGMLLRDLEPEPVELETPQQSPVVGEE